MDHVARILAVLRLAMLQSQIVGRAGLLFFCALAGPALASNTSAPAFPDDYVLGGHDLVTYFEPAAAQRGPTLGKQSHALVYQGKYYAFSSAENARAFTAAPQQYLPAYEGYCAYGLAYKRVLPPDPAIFDIYDGRLYLQNNADRRNKWRKRKPYFIRKASRHWPGLAPTLTVAEGLQ